MSVVLRAYANDLTTFIAEFDETQQWRYQDSEFDEGLARVVVPHDSVAVQATPAMLNGDVLVKVRIDGVDRMGFIIGRRWRQRRDSYDPIQIVGRGLLSVTDRAVTLPAGGMNGPPNDYRLFAWNGFDYVMRAGWGDPVSLGTYDNPTDPQIMPEDGWAETEIQRIRLGAEIPPPPFPWGTSTYPSASLNGTWTLTFDGRTTAPLQYNVVESATQGRAEIKAALEGLSNIDEVTVTGSDPWDIEFTGTSLSGEGQLPLLQLNHTDLRHTHYSWHVQRQQAASGDVDANEVIPGWPDGKAEWFGNFGVTQYYRRILDVAAEPSAAGPARLFVAGLADYEVSFDGQALGSGEAYRMSNWLVTLLETQHVLGIRAEGPVIVVIVQDLGDEIGFAYFRSFTPAIFGGPGAPDPWYAFGPDDPHGVTPGFMLGRLYDEATERGVLVGARTFTDALDSGGNAWPDDVELGLLVGNDTLQDVLGRLSDIDVSGDVDTDLNFRVWSGPRNDRTATVVLSPDDVFELSVETDDETFDAALTRWAEGWLYRHEPADGLRSETFLSLGTVPTEAMAFELSGKELGRLGATRSVYNFMTVESQGLPVPMQDYSVGDLITGPVLTSIVGSWSTGTVRVQTLQAQVNESGDVEWVHQVVPV